MAKFKVPATWMTYAVIEIEADTLEQAIEKAINREGLTSGLISGPPQYIPDSFTVDRDEAEELNA